jgi:two-component system, cell cycle sensor histidine kinase and response regulator CckA
MSERSFLSPAYEGTGMREVGRSGPYWPILIVAAVIILLGSVGSSHGESVIKVGVYDFAPLVFVNEEGKPEGLFIDVLEQVARKEDWPIKYVPGTWEQCLERVKTGEIDLITCIGYSEERAASMDFTKQFLFLDWGRLYEKIGSDSESIFDLAGKKVAVLKGSIYTSGFKSLLNRFDVRAELVEKDDYRQVFRAIENGEVKAGINGRVAGILLAPEYKIKPTEILFSPVKLAFATPKGKGSRLLTTLDTSIAQLKADESSLYYQRLKYWTKFYTKRSHVSPWLFRGLLAAALASILSLGFVYLLRRQVGIRTSQLTLSNEALQESEAKFRMLVERMPVITYTAALDTQSSTTYISPQVESLLGFTQKEYLADPDLWRKNLHEDDRERVLAKIVQSHATGEPFVCEYRILGKDDSVRWFHDEAGVVHDEQGRPLSLLGVMMDITESKRAEKELEKSEALLSEAERVARIGNWEWDARTGEVYWSAGMYRILGVNPEEFRPDHRSYLRFVPDEDRDAHERKIEESLLRKEQFEDEYRLVTPSGEDKTMWVHGYVRLDDDGKPTGLRGTTQDITERRRVQAQLEESEARVRMKLDSIVSPDGDIGNLELDDVIDTGEIQELMDDFYGITNIGMGIVDLNGKALVGTGWQDICVRFHRSHPETVKNCMASDTQLASHLQEGEFRLYRCLNNMWDIATPIMVGGNHLGNLFLGQFFFEDEEPDYAIFRARAREYGFDEREYLEALDRVPRWSRETVDRVMRFYAKMTRILSRLSFSNIELARSIAEREHLLDSLKESEQRYRLLADNTLDVIWQMDIDQRFTYVNPAIFPMTGYTPAEWIGTGLSDHCDEGNFMKMARVASEEIQRGGDSSGVIIEAEMLKKDGEPFFVEIRGKVILGEDGVPAALQGVTRDVTDRKKAEQALKTSEERYRTVVEESFDGVFIQKRTVITFANSRLHEMLGYELGELEGLDHWLVYHPDYRDITRSRAQARLRGEAVPSRYEVDLLRKDGISIPGEINAKVIRFDNEPGIQVWIRDLTEEKLLEKRLVEAQKMEAIGTLAGGIAHDFNNLLHIIAGHAELLEMELVDRDMRFEEISAIRQAAHRGADLVKQILTFSRRVDRKLKSINLNEDVRNTERLLYRTIPKMIDIELHLEDGLKPIHADSTQIEQMLINLAVNAKDAMPEGGKLTVETRNVLLDEGYCRKHAELIPGLYVLLKVSDTGHGMEEEVLQHIFEPFFTTKGLADGTGLGLATVFGIVKMHGGHIVCESEVGKGTSFNVFFPVAEADVPKADQGERLAPIAGGSETILVVDDESMIRDLAKRILEKSGYSVLTASSGVEALNVYSGERSRISLVILDLIMPEMGGKQCLEKLLEIDPQVKALVASGFAVTGDTKAFLDAEAKGMVSKPFNMRELLRAVRHVLDGV